MVIRRFYSLESKRRRARCTRRLSTAGPCAESCECQDIQAHEQSTLAPLYDLLCTLYYGDDRLGMYIDNVHRTNRVTATRLANEAIRWGLSKERSVAIIDEVLERSPDAIAAAREETKGVPPELVTVVEGQLEQLRKTN